jgi:ATP-dependent DNA helicase DinG
VSTTTTPKTFAQAEAVLAQSLPGYAPRTTQQRAAASVEQALATGEHLLLQAGCGTGKSIALLVPALQAGRRVVVSTATKALQAQYINKDIPFLAEHLGVKFTYALLQGRSNYFCMNRAALVSAEEPMAADMVAEASAEGFGGLRANFSFEVPNGLWSKVNGNSEECDELGCKNMGGCFVQVARGKAATAQVVVVNHSLLASDCAAGFNPLLGEYHVVVVDEVHELPDYAIGAFETRFSELSVRNLRSAVRNFAIRIYGDTPFLDECSEALGSVTSLFWMALTAQMPEKETALRITPTVITRASDEWVNLANALWRYAKAVEALPLPIAEDDVKRYRILRKQALNLASKFDGLINDEFSTTVRWMEWATNFRGQRHLVVRAQPIEVGPFLQQFLYKGRVVIGASATVAPGGKFEFVAGRLGLTEGDYRGLDVGTNFDYAHMALTYIPALPAPAGQTQRDWEAVMPSQVQALLQASQGRALVLFTSIRQLERVYDMVAPTLPWTVYRQGQMPQDKLMAAFKEDVHSVLFATKTWFTGVDVQGEALSLVILDKLPFPSPGDPVVEATSDLYDARYGARAGFNRYMLPQTQMSLEQAYGRLVRTVTDRGVFACLDSRLLKGWGAGMAAKLPPAPRVRDIGTVQAFFAVPSAPEDGYDIEPF